MEQLTEEMQQAFGLIENTSQNLYITGKAGTGKTTFLKYIVKNTKKKYVVTAPTGIAAINANGMTLHRLFNIPFSFQDPYSQMHGKINLAKISLFTQLELLIIDEISMVRPDILDYIDNKLKLYRLSSEPFGGVQVVMFGDLYQLPPVVKKKEKEMFDAFYKGIYFFDAHVFGKTSFKIIELTHVFRQADPQFVEILNRIRKYKLTNLDMENLDVIRDRRESSKFDNQHIHICSLRRDVQLINAKMLGIPTDTFNAEYKGDFDPDSAPCDGILQLRVGARVMTLVNDPIQNFYNGSTGEVVEIKPEYIVVKMDSTGMNVTISKHKWSSCEYGIEGNKIISIEKGSCEQFPLSLAWAITVHKSQGMTFDKITLHTKRIFAPGQLYVALSRCKTLEGIVSESFISKSCIIADDRIVAFDEACCKNNNIFDKKTYQMMNK